MVFRTRLFFHFIFILNLLIVGQDVLAQKQYAKNPHVVYEIGSDGENYTVNYTFKDHYGNLQKYTLTLPVDYSNQEINVFGIPKWLFEPYIDNAQNRIVRDAELSKGLFKIVDNVIEVDKSAVIDHYSQSFCKPIAEMIVSSLENYKRDTRNERIEMAIRFVQDIPYGIPIFANKNRHFGGVTPPPSILINGYGDCDSKAILFVSILIYLIPANEIVFLNQSEHVLSAVQGRRNGTLTFIEFKGHDYLIAETAGPGERKLGEKGNYYRNKFFVEQLSIDEPEPFEFKTEVTDQLPLAPPEMSQDKNVLVVTNQSDKAFRFQLSQDKTYWKSFTLPAERIGEYTFEKETEVFIKISEKAGKPDVFKLSTGNAYKFSYNSRNKLWEAEQSVR